MKHMLLASRYAKALYNLAKEGDEQDAVFEQIGAINSVFQGDHEITEFLTSPVVRPAEKVAALEKLISVLTISQTLKNFILLLAKKSRLGLFNEILSAYQLIADEQHGITRGTVRSATVLASEERKRIENLVARATKKQVILTYKEDPSLVGGLVAEVGSLTFDDSLILHLNRINEQLTRATN